MRRSVLALAGAALVLLMGCEATRATINGEQPQPRVSPSATKAAGAVEYRTTDGFPLAASMLAPSKVATYVFQGEELIAPPGTDYLTVEVNVTNLSPDRPAPFLIAQKPPLVLLAVPRDQAVVLGLECVAPAPFSRAFPAARWCPIQMRFGNPSINASPLTSQRIGPGATATDYLYSPQTFKTPALSRVDTTKWGLALQNSPQSFVAVVQPTS